MKKILILVILMITLILIACQSSALTHKAGPVNPQVELESINAATLLIKVENIQTTDVTLGYSIATLVQYQGETYLVTHNHWNEMLPDRYIVELRDANYTLIHTMYAHEFKQLIVYQDAGTLVLRAPDRLLDSLQPGRLEITPRLQAGDIVQVAHRSYPDITQVEITEAVIEERCYRKGVAVYTLRNLNGLPLHPGDSGGGVWHHGKLVANTWTVTTKYTTIDTAGTIDPSSETLTDLSHAAIFPEEIEW
jgi:hypothetical protein